MTIDKLKRIMWRLREVPGDTNILSLVDVRQSIMTEIGLDDRTITKYIARLIEMKQLRRINRWYFEDTAGVI